ncbi:sporulation protein YjcZ [archaeon]|nr:MAG: sporulation protein YjcZ [archaeon]
MCWYGYGYGGFYGYGYGYDLIVYLRTLVFIWFL